jgi:hypothetical protein
MISASVAACHSGKSRSAVVVGCILERDKLAPPAWEIDGILDGWDLDNLSSPSEKLSS